MHEAGYDVSLVLFRSLWLVRNLSDLFGIKERFQTSWNDKIKKNFIPIPGKRTSQNNVLETSTIPCLFF
jgi:hypothetical protein